MYDDNKICCKVSEPDVFRVTTVESKTVPSGRRVVNGGGRAYGVSSCGGRIYGVSSGGVKSSGVSSGGGRIYGVSSGGVKSSGYSSPNSMYGVSQVKRAMQS